MIFGTVLIIFVRFIPQGLMGLIGKHIRWGRA
jgi:hypothetical protein